MSADFIGSQNRIEALDTEIRAHRNLSQINVNLANDLKQCRINELRLEMIRKETLLLQQFWRNHRRLLTAKQNLLKTVAETPIKTSYILCENACGASFSSNDNHVAHKAVCANRVVEPKKVTIDEEKNQIAIFDNNFGEALQTLSDLCTKPPKKRRRSEECLLDGAYWTR